MSLQIPITLVSGFLGAGKTTLLQYILSHCEDIRCAVIVNDMGEINIDAHLLKEKGVLHLGIQQLTNGCICCSLSSALEGELTAIAARGDIDYILIESTGIADPGEIARMIDFRNDQGESLSDITHLDSKITVVDSNNFIEMLYDEAPLSEEENLEHAYNTVSQVLISQIEGADTIILHKTDLVKPEKLDLLRSLIAECNPSAELIPASKGEVPIKRILFAQKHSMEDSFRDASFDAVLQKHDHHDHCTDAHCDCHSHGNSHGIQSFVFRARVPFHPERLKQWLESDWEGVIRAKGLFWLASRPSEIELLQLVGSTLDIVAIGSWWADTPKAEWPQDAALLSEIEAEWDTVVGDKKQELVIIGAHMDIPALTKGFEQALLTTDELAYDDTFWIDAGDDFPQWEFE